jgi:hypothetical protein
VKRYDLLLIELLQQLDQKADKLISLLEKGQHTKDGSDDRTNSENGSPNSF